MRTKIKLVSVLLVSTLFFFACSKDENGEPAKIIQLPEVGNLEISAITTASFAYKASVANDGGSEITEKGICYGEKQNPTVSDTKISAGKGKESFSGSIENLTAEKTYFVRAYATNSKGTGYGKQAKVTLLALKTLVGAEEAYPGEKGEVVTTTLNGVKVKCNKINGQLIFQGDIVISEKTQTKGVAINEEHSGRWKNNTFVYKIDEGFRNKERIAQAIEMYAQTNIKFKEQTNEANYVLFKYHPKGCNSYLGMIGGQQIINIADWGTAGNIAHEIGHALGLFHEQSHPNRDKFVKVNFENIIEGFENNFEKYAVVNYFTKDYDFESIMGYPSFAFSKGNKPTMTKLDGTTFNSQRKKFSVRDIEIINKLYPKLADLEVFKTEIALEVGESAKVEITAGTGEYEVKTTNPDIATASLSKNMITINALAKGVTEIVVTDKNTEQTQRIKVTVKEKIDTSTYIEFTTEKAVGETIKLSIKADEQDKADIWIDLNNNGVKDDNEGDVQLYSGKYPKDNDYKDYTLGSQTIRVYGKVVAFITFGDRKYNYQERKWIYIGQKITKLDVSQNMQLKELYCKSNQLTSLDILKNTRLEYLGCGNNSLTNLNVSQNTQLKGLYCYNNQLSNLDVSKNMQLKEFYCNGNQLTNLDVSNNRQLEDLDCTGNPLNTIDVSQNQNLKRLDCHSNQLSNLDVSNNTQLEFLGCSGNSLTSLDASNNTLLKELNCSNNQLTNLDVSQNINLKLLQCADNQLTSLDVSNCPLYFEGGGIAYKLTCRGNPLTCIKVSEEQMKNLPHPMWEKDDRAGYSTDCNAITEPDTSTYIELTTTKAVGETIKLAIGASEYHKAGVWIDLNNNGIKDANEGDVEFYSSYYPNIDRDYKDYTLASQTIRVYGKIDKFFCNDNQLSSLDLSQNTKLTELGCSSNQLTSLDVLKNTSLTYLFCDNNQLTSLDVSQNISFLERVNCRKNQLSSLDVSLNKRLKQLDCSSNQLTSLDVSNGVLWYLNCTSNRLNCIKVTQKQLGYHVKNYKKDDTATYNTNCN